MLQISEAISVLKAHGYRVTKPREVAKPVTGLNAIGRPFSANYDPRYRMRYRASVRASYGPSTAACHRSASRAYRAMMEIKHAGNPDVLKDIFARNGVAS